MISAAIVSETTSSELKFFILHSYLTALITNSIKKQTPAPIRYNIVKNETKGMKDATR